MNDHNSLHNRVCETYKNRFGGYYANGKSYSPERIAECVDKFHEFNLNCSRHPTLNEFMRVSKIGGRDLALKIFNHCKYDVKFITVKKGQRHVGPLSRAERFAECASLDMYFLYLAWRSRPIHSYKHEIKNIHGLNLSNRTISEWF